MKAVLTFLIWMLGQQAGGSLEGVVVRSGTTQPLTNVEVGLWPTSAVAKTDASGRYLFVNVAYGRYTLVVLHDGMKIKVPVVLNSQRLDTTLGVPSPPAITGTVYDPNGERLAGARVQAFRLVYTSSGQRMKSLMSGTTNDLGDYRLFWLRPGEYTMAASYSDREQRSATAGLQLTSNLSRPDEGYPLIYSQKVNLVPGSENTKVDLFLKEGAFATVAGRLIAQDGKPTCGRLALVAEGVAVNTDKDFGPVVCGAFTIPGVSPGAYALLAVHFGMASDVVPVNVGNRGVTDVLVEMKKTVDVPGRILLDGSSLRSGKGIRVVLARASRQIDQRIEAISDPDGSFRVKDVGPGAFDILIEALPEDTFVNTIRFRGRDAGSAMRFDSLSQKELDDSPLDVQLSSNGGVVEGVVLDRAGQPVPGAQVVLAPFLLGPRMRADQYKVGTTDVVGRFRIGGIGPGNYRAFAFEEIEEGAYYALTYNPSSTVQFLNRGVSLTFPGAGRQLRLTAIPASEIAGGLR